MKSKSIVKIIEKLGSLIDEYENKQGDCRNTEEYEAYVAITKDLENFALFVIRSIID